MNFIIVGVARCGTTSLFHYLKQHPDIQFPEIKEPKYFSSIDQHFPHNGPGDFSVDDKIIRCEKKYDNLFSDLDSANCIGEASSDYFYFYKNTIPQIKKKFGDIKIIICLRNPVERAFSAYNNLIRDSREKLTFYEGLLKENDRIKSNYDWMWHYANGGLYSEGINAFKESFSHVKVIFNDHLSDNTFDTLKDIFIFLNVDSEFKPNIENRYSTSGRPKNFVVEILSSRIGVLNAIRSTILKIFPRNLLELIASRLFIKEKIDYDSRLFLDNFFKKDINKLEKILDVDLSTWK